MSIKAKDIKNIISQVNDDADVEVTFNGSALGCLAEQISVDEEGNLVLDITHYCGE